MDNPHKSAFQYQSLDADRPTHEIRLLKLSPKNASENSDLIFACEMIHANTEDAVEYKALSYTWGDVADGTCDIMVNDCLVEVRINLYHALSQIQKSFSEEVLLWVDAICIDQSNIEERNHQVSHMHKLYERAEQVIVWLGPEADDSKTAMKFLERLYVHINDIPTFWATLTPADLFINLPPLSKMLLRPYWQRVWVVQELMAGKNTVVLCGQDQIAWSHLDRVQRAYFDTQLDVSRSVVSVVGSDPQHVFLISSLYTEGPRAVHRSQTALTGGWTLFNTLKYYLRTKKATDPRDMIYALSSAANLPGKEEIIVDYNQSVVELYTQFTRTEMLKTGKLDMWGALSERQSEILGLPSWVVDWSFDVNEHCFLFDPFRVGPERYFHSYKAAGESKAIITFEDAHCLKVSGIQVGTIDVLCETTHRSMDSPDSLLMPALQEWSTMLLSKTKDPEVQVFQLSRTLAGDYLTLFNETFDVRVYYGLFARLVLKAQNITNKSDSPTIYTRCTETTLTGLSEQDTEALDHFYSNSVRFTMSGRRLFFNSKQDTMGVCPDATELGDVLCIPHGCTFVMVLRPNDDGTWTIVGPAYMDGFMYGYAMTLVKKGELEVKDFVLQ